MAKERLQKLLSRAGVASRRAAEELIVQGRVTVNGDTVTELGSRADPDADAIKVDGRRIRIARERVYILLNKPKGVVTTTSDPEGRPTVMGLVPAVPGLYPVGRLDYATEGLLLLTNDGAFAERVAHPRYEVERRYLAKVRGTPTAETLSRARRGVTVDGERLAVDSARVVEPGDNAWVSLALHEGKNHEVRRLMQALGHPVEKLRRVAIGPLTADDLKPGAFRHLTPREVAQFLRPADAAARRARAPQRSSEPPRSRPRPRHRSPTTVASLPRRAS